MAEPKIAVQLYSVRDECAKDLDSTLAAIAAMGYDGVEFAGFYDHTAADVRGMLARHHLQVAGAHVGLDLLAEDRIQQTVQYHLDLGNKFLIVPGVGDAHRGGLTVWRNNCSEFNRISEGLLRHGLRTGYHNHHFEFSPLPDSDGEAIWDVIAKNTAPQFVLQLDLGNALQGGAQLTSLIARYPGRYTTVHLKEFPDGLPGEGDVPWTEVFSLLRDQNATDWFIVEQEGDKYPPMKYIALWLQHLRAYPGFAG